MIELVKAGRKPGELAKEFGCHASSIMHWMRQADEASDIARLQAGALSASERQELIELRRKLRQVQMECDIFTKGYGLVCQQRRQDVYPARALIAAGPSRTTRTYDVQDP